MKAQTDLVLTHDRSRVVPLGDPDGNPFFWVACKGEEVPDNVLTVGGSKAPAKKKSAKAGE